MSLNYVSVVMDFYDGSGDPVTAGTVTCTPTAMSADPTDHVVITRAPVVARLFGNPLPAISLAATDNGSLSPSGWGWLIQGVFPGAPPGQVFAVPFAGGAVQFLSGLLTA